MMRTSLPAAIGAAAALLFLFFGCAGQVAPEGGPADTTPPSIVSVYPAPNSVNFRDSRIALEFSEYVDRASAEKAVFISPYVSEIEFEWSGREVEILFRSGLKPNTTYVLTLGTDIVDFNNRNRMAGAFTLAFSTGPAIDRGAITGRVYDPKPEGVMVFAYMLDGIRPDTLNAAVSKPDYITQTGADGTFGLSHLRLGSYRLFAVRDEYRDLLYTPEVDAAGALTRDITISESDTLAASCNFTLALEDTAAPRLIAAESRDRQHVLLTFSELLDTASVTPAALIITDTLSSRMLGVTHAFIADPASPRSVIVRTELQSPGAGYRLTAKGFRDRAQHPTAPSASSLSFRASDAADTTAPRLVAATVRDTTTRVLTDEQFRFDFSDVLLPSAESAFTFRLGDTSGVPFGLTRTRSGAGVILSPRAALLPKSRYVIRVQYDSIRSLSGSALKDSAQVFRYTTIDPDNFSSMEGSVEGRALADTSVTVVEAIATADRTAVRPAHARVTKDRTFSFPLLTEGVYALRAFSDFNRNGALDAGKVYPFRTSEPFVIGRDTVKVRARWPVEGVILR